MDHFDTDHEESEDGENAPSQRPAVNTDHEDTDDDENMPSIRPAVRTPSSLGEIREVGTHPVFPPVDTQSVSIGPMEQPAETHPANGNGNDSPINPPDRLNVRRFDGTHSE